MLNVLCGLFAIDLSIFRKNIHIEIVNILLGVILFQTLRRETLVSTVEDRVRIFNRF
jgi:hypothetical protein